MNNNTLHTHEYKHLKSNNEDLVKYLDRVHWDFFVTLSFENRVNPLTVSSKMDEISSHYLIENNIVWFMEKSETGSYHVHMVIKSIDVPKSLSETSKNPDPSISRKQPSLENYNRIMSSMEKIFRIDGKGKIGYGRLYRVFRRYGNVDFRMYDNSRSVRCLSYITKTYNTINYIDSSSFINSSIFSNRLGVTV
jgi:hypothetical protein